MVLKADEKSANRILAWVWGPSRCLYRVFKMNSLASSTPLPGHYTNCRESRLRSVTVRMMDFMIFSNVFVTREVSATGRKSLGSFGLSFFGIGITVDNFQIAGTMHVSTEVWKRCWETPLSWSAQNFRVLPQIPSGPGHLFTLICLKSLINNSGIVMDEWLFQSSNLWSKVICFKTSKERWSETHKRLKKTPFN